MKRKFNKGENCFQFYKILSPLSLVFISRVLPTLYGWLQRRGILHIVKNKKSMQRKSSRLDNASGEHNKNRYHEQVLSSFFFTSFSDTFSARDMFEEFKSFGEINEVIILSKRSSVQQNSAEEFGSTSAYVDKPPSPIL